MVNGRMLYVNHAEQVSQPSVRSANGKLDAQNGPLNSVQGSLANNSLRDMYSSNRALTPRYCKIWENEATRAGGGCIGEFEAQEVTLMIAEP